MSELVFTDRGFIVRCRPVVLASGGYGGHVTIVGNRERPAFLKHVPDLGFFHTPESALDQSRTWAMSWIESELQGRQKVA